MGTERKSDDDSVLFPRNINTKEERVAWEGGEHGCFIFIMSDSKYQEELEF